MFPLAFDAATGALVRGGALTAGMLQAISHATAKAAMFMAAGLIYAALGHDRIAELAGVARALPLAVLAFAVGGVALMGVVPSGAYLAKKLLLDAADTSGQWWWTLVLQVGGALTAAMSCSCSRTRCAAPANRLRRRRAGRLQEIAALALALCSLLRSWPSAPCRAPRSRCH